MRTKRGDNMAFITLDDRTGRIEVAVFSDSYNEARDLLLKDSLLVVTGQVSHDDYSGTLKMRADNIQLLADIRQERARELCLSVNASTLPTRSEEHTSELQSRGHLVCRLLLEKKKLNIHKTR